MGESLRGCHIVIMVKEARVNEVHAIFYDTGTAQ